MTQANIFEDPTFVYIQELHATQQVPHLAASLDELLRSYNNGALFAELGAGMGHLALEMHRRHFPVLVEEPSEQSLERLSQREPEFHAFLESHEQLFAQGLLQYARHLVKNGEGVLSGAYSNEGPLAVMRTVDGRHIVESHVETPELLEKSLAGLRHGLRKSAPLALSVQSVPRGEQETYGVSVDNEPVRYYAWTSYDLSEGRVARLRHIRGKGMQSISHIQTKLALTLNRFYKLAMNAGFSDYQFSRDGRWFVMR